MTRLRSRIRRLEFNSPLREDERPITPEEQARYDRIWARVLKEHGEPPLNPDGSIAFDTWECLVWLDSSLLNIDRYPEGKRLWEAAGCPEIPSRGDGGGTGE